MLKAENISKSYREGAGSKLKVLEDLSIELFAGQVVSITGESGVGKSTLLHVLGFLDTPDLGTILFNKLDISKLTDSQLSRIRNSEIGFIFQFHYLLPEFDARENISLPALLAGTNRTSAEKSADEILSEIGLSNRANHFPNELSGGEQQRIALARALINKPKLILADEPTGNLDSKNEEHLVELLIKLSRNIGTAVVLATHNRELAKMADHSYLLKDKKLFLNR
ncbi:ABC transporter ATP-binding protein [bacterium]|nr:ABC transporter ATP-binding protein [bacterium]